MQLVSKHCVGRKGVASGWTSLILCLGALAVTPNLRAQIDYIETNVTLVTIGGGPIVACGSLAGSANGNTLQNSQFNGPVSMALNSQGTLFIADRTNNAVRMVTSAGDVNTSLTSTYISGLSQVIGVAIDAGDNLYVLTQGDKMLRKYNSLGNLLFSYTLPSVPTALAVTLDTSTNIFITFTNKTILNFAQNSNSITGYKTNVAVGVKWQPAGIAWRGDGVLAVSDTLNSEIWQVLPTNNAVPTPYTGGATNGWLDGDPRFALFKQPTGLAWTSDGQLIVADRGNNAVRRVDASGNTSTIYGVNSKLWSSTVCASLIYAGWVDGAPGPYGTNASGRAPDSVVISPTGSIFVTELSYDLLREINGLGVLPVNSPGVVTTNGTGTNTTTTTNVTTFVNPPVINPSYGYFPECQLITVTSSNKTVYYTEDGTTPTTNSLQVTNMVQQLPAGNYIGSLLWCNSQHDLSFLQLIAVSDNGSNFSTVLTGQSSPINQIGMPAGGLAGIGSTAIIPVVIDLQSNGVLASLQFRVEVTPTTTNTPPISGLSLLPISTNDFVPLIGPAAGNAPVNYETFAYGATSNGQGLAIIAAGDNSGFSVQNFAVAALLAVTIPPSATVGQTYTLNVLYPSGTSDGSEDEVTLVPMASQTLTVSNLVYFEGDSSPSTGYSAGQFGDGALFNSDVNNALMASVGIHVPFSFSDAFDAMDVYPETPDGELGDGFITFLDWQHILFRSLGLETNNWVRFWTNGGVRAHEQVSWSPGGTPIPIGSPPSELSLGKTKSVAKASVNLPPGQVWLRQLTISAGTSVNNLPGDTCSIPVYAKVLPGYSVAGLQFRAILSAAGGAPPPGAIQFSSAPGIPIPAESHGLSSNDIVCAWSLFDPFSPPLTGSNLIGSITFQVPVNAQPGQSYSLHFLGVDGALDLNTPYQMDSVPGSAWVLSTAQAAPQITSDEWRTFFFGSTTNALAADNADPDGDGFPNWAEYLAGTNPNDPLSKMQFSGAAFAGASPQNINLSWLTAPGKTYIMESSLSLGGTNWTAVNTNTGDGNMFQFSLTNHTGNTRFYRIRLQP